MSCKKEVFLLQLWRSLNFLSRIIGIVFGLSTPIYPAFCRKIPKECFLLMPSLTKHKVEKVAVFLYHSFINANFLRFYAAFSFWCKKGGILTFTRKLCLKMAKITFPTTWSFTFLRGRMPLEPPYRVLPHFIEPPLLKTWITRLFGRNNWGVTGASRSK